MALPDLTGQNIQDTYQRVLQTDATGSMRDGTGSLFLPVSASHAITASYAETALIEITKEVSSSYAETASMASSNFKVQGNITASGEISASGTVTANEFALGETGDQNLRIYKSGDAAAIKSNINNASIRIGGVSNNVNTNAAKFNFGNRSVSIENGFHITASGNISSSGTLSADIYRINEQGAIGYNVSTGVMVFGSATEKTELDATNIKLDAPVTASGAISASGNLFMGDVLNSNGINIIGFSNVNNSVNIGPNTTTPVKIHGHITASGQISASGTDTHYIGGNLFVGNYNKYVKAQSFYTNDIQGLVYNSGVQVGNTTGNYTTVQGAAIGGIRLLGNVTASRNISSSGNYTGVSASLDYLTTTGNISSSGTIVAQDFATPGKIYLNSNIINTGGDYIEYANDGFFYKGKGDFHQNLEVGTTLLVNSHLTASGNISSSGNIVADYYDATTSGIGYKLDGVKVVYIDSTKYHFGRQGTGTVISGSTIELGKESTTHITASGNISSSGNIYANQINLNGETIRVDQDFIDIPSSGLIVTKGIKAESHITASGNISSSGYVYGDRGIFAERLQTPAWRFTDIEITSDNGPINFIGPGGINIAMNTAGGHITASGNISSSATVTGISGSFHALQGDTTQATGLNVNGFIFATNITASGDISASGTFSADNFIVNGHITASGNISASGDGFFDNVTITDDLNVTDDIIVGNLSNIKVGSTAVVAFQATQALFQQNVKIQDTDKLILGNSAAVSPYVNDTEMWHDGTNSNIVNNNGRLNISSSFGILFETHITASGNISSSGTVTADQINIDNVIFADRSSDIFRLGSGLPAGTAHITNFAVSADPAAVPGVRMNATSGDITASGAISASGDITADDIFIPKLGGKIQFAGDIQTYIGTTGTPEQLEIHADSDIRLQPDEDVIIYQSSTEWARFSGDKRGLYIQGNITASGEISASGNVLADHVLADRVYVGPHDDSARLTFDDTSVVNNMGLLNQGNITASNDISASGTVTSKYRDYAFESTTNISSGDIITIGTGPSGVNGDIVRGRVYCMDASQQWEPVDANASATSTGMLGIAIEDDTPTFLLKGVMHHTNFGTGGATGNPLYISETAGTVTGTAPTTAGAYVRIIGYQINLGNRGIFFDPDKTWVELT